MAPPLDVHVWSDVACPWCFIGKRRFEAAVRRFDGDVSIEYRSFELSPDTPVDFEGNEVDFLSAHKGMPADQVEQMLTHVTDLATAEGLHYGLVDLAADVGLNRDETRRALTAGTYADAVQEDIAEAREFGIRGVPFFVIDGKYGVSGAQSPDVFVAALERAAADRD
jgi:predicted DsbA family dithiol-disulfide isomerase